MVPKLTISYITREKCIFSSPTLDLLNQQLWRAGALHRQTHKVILMHAQFQNPWSTQTDSRCMHSITMQSPPGQCDQAQIPSWATLKQKFLSYCTLHTCCSAHHHEPYASFRQLPIFTQAAPSTWPACCTVSHCQSKSSLLSKPHLSQPTFPTALAYSVPFLVWSCKTLVCLPWIVYQFLSG